jgi:oligopeptide/dipeptide ABC transporter ATP-binding protein
MSAPVLEVAGLRVAYRGEGAPVQALRGVDLVVARGEIVGLVGESGCGKSTLAAALLGLLPPAARVEAGTVRLGGADLLRLPERERRRLRGPDVALVPQDAMSAFSPVHRLGDQLVDFQHNLPGLSRRERRERAGAMLARTGLADPRACLDRYPHELSGGMRQRAAIAAALLLRPALLVADEATTALDVTMEAQILHLLRGLREETGGAILVVTHHLGVVGEICDRVHVMYAGEIVEEGTVAEVHLDPRHPYSRALLACDPAGLDGHRRILPVIPGRPPDLARPPPGCGFAARCPLASARCRAETPPRVRLSATRAVLCHAVAA